MQYMRRLSYVILLLLTLSAGLICSSNCHNCYNIAGAGASADSAENRMAQFIISEPDCALPVQVEKIQLTVVQLSARQQLKRLSESVFGHAANVVTTYSLLQRIYRSCTIIRGLETYDICFPFSSFW